MTNSNSGDIDLEIIPARKLVEFEGGTLEFSCYSEIVQSFFAASDKKKMLMGYFSAGENTAHFFCDDMDAERTVSIKPDDNLIVAVY